MFVVNGRLLRDNDKLIQYTTITIKTSNEESVYCGFDNFYPLKYDSLALVLICLLITIVGLISFNTPDNRFYFHINIVSYSNAQVVPWETVL